MSIRSASLRSAALLVGVISLYAAVAIAWTYPLVRLATTHTVLPLATSAGLARNDQAYSISAASRNAAAIAAGDLARLIDWRLCYPTPHAAALGEHGIELGILALPGQLLSGSPILAYNSACLLLILIAGTSTFWLVRHWTSSAVAGVVAGLAFAFHPEQIGDLVHPFVMGIHWIPLVLLALDRLLETGRTRWAVLLAAAGSLQSWVGAYPLMVLAAFVGPYGVLRVLQHRDMLDRGRLLRLAAAAATVVLAASIVLLPYAGAAGWGATRRRGLLVAFPLLLPGARLALGGTTLVLAALLLVLRGGRRSPVGPVLAAGTTCIVLAGGGRLWPGGPVFHGVYPWLARHVWLLAIVRVPAAIRTGAYLAVSLLAGLGLGRLLDRLSPRALPRLGLGVACGALLLVEYLNPAASRAVYGIASTVVLVPRQPDAQVLEAYATFDRRGLGGPLVEIPFDEDGKGIVGRMPGYSLLAAYHGHETAACFTSHLPPSYYEVNRMVVDVGHGRQSGLVELAAAGLRNVVVHDGVFGRRAGALAAMPGVETLYRSRQVSAFRITRPVAPHHDTALLRLDGASLGHFESKGHRYRVAELAVRNASPHVWALPHPVAPLGIRWRYVGPDGSAAGTWHEGTTMLPLALAGNATATIRAKLTRPPIGCDCAVEVEVPALGWHAVSAAPAR